MLREHLADPAEPRSTVEPRSARTAASVRPASRWGPERTGSRRRRSPWSSVASASTGSTGQGRPGDPVSRLLLDRDPVWIGWIEAISYLAKSDEAWARQCGHGPRRLPAGPSIVL